MKVMVVTSSPNDDGLTAACGIAAEKGVHEAGGEVVKINLNKLNVGTCHACGNGWGPCRDNHQCQVKDDFQRIHEDMENMDAFVFITPVYWGDMSESAKAFFDRIRRNEAFKKENAFLEEKPVILVAAAGGSGNGTIPCLTQMERFLMHVRADKFDFVSITRKSREYKLEAIKAGAKAMVDYTKENSSKTP